MTESERSARRPRRCERCGERRRVRILYGYPDHELFEQAERGEVMLGGCIIEEDAPRWGCAVCGFRSAELDTWTGVDGPRHGEFGYFHQVLSASMVPSSPVDEWAALQFALTFDGYAAFGTDEVHRLFTEARERFERTGKLPDNIAVMRGCLFFAQRAAHHTDTSIREPFTLALIEALRAHGC